MINTILTPTAIWKDFSIPEGLNVQILNIERQANFVTSKVMIEGRTLKDGSVKTEGWSIETDGSVKLNGHLVVPDSLELKREIMDEAHKSKYSVHPGENKM